jgi:hypothetical protein
VAGLLTLLMIIVETNAFGLLRVRERSAAAVVPDFLRIDGETHAGEAHSGLEPEAEAVSAGTRGSTPYHT